MEVRWAEFADKATIVALTIAAVAILAAGTTSWISYTYNTTLEAKTLEARARLTPEWGIAAAEFEKELALLRERTEQLGKALADADARSAGNRRQIADLEKAVEATAARSAGLDKEVVAIKASIDKSRIEGEPLKEKEKPEQGGGKHVQLVGSLQKFAGTRTTILAGDDAPEAAEVGSSLNALLTEAGWVSAKWKWVGVSGLTGVVVLTKEGIDPSIDQVAAATVGVMRSAGFNAVKASWPTNADWRQFRGTLSGPDSPPPTEAPIRIVIGARATVQP